MKALATFALLAFLAVTGEAASSAWEDDALDLSAITSPLLSITIPQAPPGEHGITLIIVGPDPDLPPLPTEPDVRLVGNIPEPTSGLHLLVRTALLALRRRPQ